MAQSGSDRDTKASSLLDALIEDAHASSASEIREEIAASGGDPEKIAAQMKQRALGLVLHSRKARLQYARSKLTHQAPSSSSLSNRQPAKIRDRLRQLVSANQSFASGRVALAFRNGITQSDSDLLSLWQDLIDLGAVSDDELFD